MSTQLSEITPQHLRTLVLDYLCHHSYTETARAFARDSAIRSSEPTADSSTSTSTSTSNDEYLSEEVIRLVQLRREIKLHILSGRVAEATDLLKEYFPTVLEDSDDMDTSGSPPPKEPRPHPDIPYTSQTSVNPLHISLNLKILAFIEATRTVSLDYPADDGRSHMRLPHLDDPGENKKHQILLLHRAQKLYSEVESLQDAKDKEVYRKELQHVGGLLAYIEPENSPLAKYLSQERREAVADQINSAILYRMNHPAVSHLELYSRYTYSLWSLMHDMQVPLPPLASRPSGLPRGLFVPQSPIDAVVVPAKGTNTPEKEKESPEIVPVFDLRQFANSK